MGLQTVEGEDRGTVDLYKLTSCAWCGKVKELLDCLGVRYRYLDVDLLTEEDQGKVIGFLDKIAEEWGFPVLLIHGKYMLPGYKEKETRRLLGFEETSDANSFAAAAPEAVSPETEQAYERLVKFSRKKGYFLNPDPPFTKQLVGSLLVNQKRYGYWACPCRLASGDRNKDRDIICPCDYMEPDVQDFGACFCALYVSEEVSLGKKQVETVPERRNRKPE